MTSVPIRTAFVTDPAGVAEVFRAPDLQAVLFFALFILTDPPTSPVKYRNWEAWRRVQRRAGHTFPHGIGVFAREVSPWRASVLMSRFDRGSRLSR